MSKRKSFEDQIRQSLKEAEQGKVLEYQFGDLTSDEEYYGGEDCLDNIKTKNDTVSNSTRKLK